MRKVDKRGRNKTNRFARLDHYVLSSAAYRALSPNARSLLVELSMLHNGVNNGQLFLSVRDAADRMGVADHHAASRAFQELSDLGFVEPSGAARFGPNDGEGRRARAWRLTWETVPTISKTATNEFLERQPEPGSREHKRMIAGQKALKRLKRKIAGVDCTPATSGTVVDSTFMPATSGEAKPGTVVDCTPAIPASAHVSMKADHGGIHPTYKIPSTTQPKEASPTARNRARAEIRQWANDIGAGAQRLLSRLSDVNESKLSRFMTDTENRRSLTVEQLDALLTAIRAQPPKRAAAK